MEAVRRAFCVILLSVFAGTAGATAASAATPTAGAEPQPEKLWEAFPLNPRPAKPQATRKRPSKPLVGVGGLPAKQAPGARRDSPGTNVAGEPGGGAAEKSSGGDDKSVVKIVLIALGAAQLVLLALLLVMFWPELKSFGHRVRRAWHWVARRLPDIAWEPRFVPAGLKDRLLRRGDRDAYFAPRPTWPLEEPHVRPPVQAEKRTLPPPAEAAPATSDGAGEVAPPPPPRPVPPPAAPERKEEPAPVREAATPLDAAIADARRLRQPLSLLVAKPNPPTLEVEVRLAAALSRALGDAGTVSLGPGRGDETVSFVLAGVLAKRARTVAETVVEELVKDEDPVEVSVGIAAFPRHAARGSELVEAAERALDRALEWGAHQVEVAGGEPAEPPAMADVLAREAADTRERVTARSSGRS